MLAALILLCSSLGCAFVQPALSAQRLGAHSAATFVSESTRACNPVWSLTAVPEARRGQSGEGRREKSRQIALMTKIQQRGGEGDWQSVLALLDKAKAKAFVPDSYVW
jgi:hypothetical protein